MKRITLITLLGLACSSPAFSGEAFPHAYENGGYWEGMQQTATAPREDESSQWIRSQMVWNEEYDVYDVLPILPEDPFLERMVWSDHYTDYVPAGMAFRAILDAATGKGQPEFRMAHGELVPCPKLAQTTAGQQLASLF